MGAHSATLDGRVPVRRLARISHKPNGLVKNPSQPQLVAAETSTRREGLVQRALLRANPERVPSHTMRDESKPFGRISRPSGEKCGLGRLKRLWTSERGQATAEYAILSLWTVIIVIATFEAVRVALLDFYYNIASLLCLPIP